MNTTACYGRRVLAVLVDNTFTLCCSSWSPPVAVGADNATWGNGLAHGIALRSGNLVAAIRTDCADPTSSNSFPSNCTTNPDGSHAAWDPETGIVHPIINRVLISSDSGRSFRAGGPTQPAARTETA